MPNTYKPYEYILYTIGDTTGASFDALSSVPGIFIFRGDLNDTNPANAHVINVTQINAYEDSFRGDDPISVFEAKNLVLHQDLPYFLRMRNAGATGVYDVFPFYPYPRSPAVGPSIAYKDSNQYSSGFFQGESAFPEQERFHQFRDSGTIVYHPIDQRIFVGDGGAGANLIWDVETSSNPPTFIKNTSWSPILDGLTNPVRVPILTRSLVVSEDQKYLFNSNPGYTPYIYERPGPFVTHIDRPENNMIRLTNPVGTPVSQGGCFHDPFNNELHYSTSSGNTATIAIDSMTLVNGITNSNPGMVSSNGELNTISTTATLTGIHFADHDLCVASFATSTGTSTYLLRRISGEWIIQTYPFTENPQEGVISNPYQGVISWPLDKRYILVSTTNSNIRYHNWYRRNGYTYEYVGPLVVGGYPEIYRAAGTFRIQNSGLLWVNGIQIDGYDSIIATPWSSTTKAIMDLQPIHHLAPEDGDYTQAIFDIGTARVRPDGTPHTYTREAQYRHTDIGNPSLGKTIVSTGSLGLTKNIYYRAHTFSRDTSNITQTTKTFPDLAGQTAGTVVLLFKTSSDFSGYSSTSTNYVNTLFKISNSTSTRLLFGLNVASGVVKFAVSYYSAGTPTTASTRKRVCDTTPLVIDTWYLVTVYQPGDGTDLDITINGVTQSYTTTGTADINAWTSNVIPLTSSTRTIGIGNSSANERPLTQFSISDAAIFNRELTAGEISNTSNVVTTAAAADTRYPTIWKTLTFALKSGDTAPFGEYGYGSTSRNVGGTAFGALANTTYKTGSTIHLFTNKYATTTLLNIITIRLEISGTVPKEDFLYLDYIYETTNGDRYKLYSADATYTEAAGGLNNVWIWTLNRLGVNRLATGTSTLRFVF